MPKWTGRFPSGSKSALLKIGIFGVWPQAKKGFEALIDTGFSGFLSMPIIEAFPLGLVLVGTTNMTLADGSVVVRYVALGGVEVTGVIQSGAILLEPSGGEVLLGVEFLERFKKTLTISPGKGIVELEDD